MAEWVRSGQRFGRLGGKGRRALGSLKVGLAGLSGLAGRESREGELPGGLGRPGAVADCRRKCKGLGPEEVGRVCVGVPGAPGTDLSSEAAALRFSRDFFGLFPWVAAGSFFPRSLSLPLKEERNKRIPT